MCSVKCDQFISHSCNESGIIMMPLNIMLPTFEVISTIHHNS